jgi:hypothetical protein
MAISGYAAFWPALVRDGGTADKNRRFAIRHEPISALLHLTMKRNSLTRIDSLQAGGRPCARCSGLAPGGDELPALYRRK